MLPPDQPGTASQPIYSVTGLMGEQEQCLHPYSCAIKRFICAIGSP